MNNVKLLTQAVLEYPHERKWTLQGLGMLRTYLEKPDVRLHVWDSRYRFPNVSMMHDHPWHFRSHIVAGIVNQKRYTYNTHGLIQMRQTILCGTGGGLCGGPERVILHAGDWEKYYEQETYTQRAEEIHISLPVDGTVTIVHREVADDADHAHVFWNVAEKWVTAEPRPATMQEVTKITEFALNRWFGNESGRRGHD